MNYDDTKNNFVNFVNGQYFWVNTCPIAYDGKICVHRELDIHLASGRSFSCCE